MARKARKLSGRLLYLRRCVIDVQGHRYKLQRNSAYSEMNFFEEGQVPVPMTYGCQSYFQGHPQFSPDAYPDATCRNRHPTQRPVGTVPGTAKMIFFDLVKRAFPALAAPSVDHDFLAANDVDATFGFIIYGFDLPSRQVVGILLYVVFGVAQ